jgi:hypothetical protein
MSLIFENSGNAAGGYGTQKVQTSGMAISGKESGQGLGEQVKGNPEFSRWWRRWISRVQRVGRSNRARGMRTIEVPTSEGKAGAEFIRYLKSF